MLNFPSAGPVKDLLERAGGRAEVLVHFCHARNYQVAGWNASAADLFALPAPSPNQSPLRWEDIPEHLASYLAHSLQQSSGATEESMPEIAHPEQPDRYFLVRLFYEGVAPTPGRDEEHWYLFCFQDTQDWLENSHATVNRKKLETIGELASGLAHDFNNLIMGIQSNAEAMLAEPSMAPAAREGLVNIIRGCSNGTSLTRSLLNYAKQQPLTLTCFDLLDLAHDVSRIAGVASGSFPVVLGSELGEGDKPIMVNGSYSSLSHCILNLIKNAREAMPNGGPVQILWEGDESEAALTVRDQGTGISEDDMARIFEPFFSTKSQGTGLGLAMVRGIMNQHGGTVEIRSTPGVGTDVSLIWPRGEVQGANGNGHSVDVRRSTQKIVRSSTHIFSESRQQSPENHFLIYVVDDDTLVREGLVSLLEHLGHRTEAFQQAEKALEKILHASPAPEMIIVDYNMPGMTGTQFISQYNDEIRRNPPAQPPQIILMSGMPPSHFDDFLSEFAHLNVSIMEKPFSLEMLRKRIGVIQEERKRQRARLQQPAKELVDTAATG